VRGAHGAPQFELRELEDACVFQNLLTIRSNPS
jgi:hypothetical protein